MQAKPVNTEKIMEFEELKSKYTELREFVLEVQRNAYKNRADWNILLGVCRDLDKANKALRRENEALKNERKEQEEMFRKEYEELKGLLKYNEKLIKKEVYNDFNFIIKEKEAKFNSEFPPIDNEKE